MQAEVASGIHRRLTVNITDALRRRFWSRVSKQASSDCWPWIAAMRNGYGAIKHDGRVHSAHRIAFILTNGEPDDDLLIGHKCDNRACCNPDHLEAITAQKNNVDARDRRTFFETCGEDAPNSVLTDSVVMQIRQLHQDNGWGARRIRTHLGLSACSKTIEKAMYGQTWKHLPMDAS